jgi:hypothetical protein
VSRFFEDSFTEATGTLVTDGVPEIGTGWTLVSGTSPVITNGRARRNSALGHVRALHGAPPSADYRVQGLYAFLTSVNSGLALLLRHSASAQTYYRVRLHSSAGIWRWEVHRFVAASGTLLASQEITVPADGTDLEVRFEAQGSDLSVWVGATQVFANLFDGSITAAGFVGLAITNNSGAATSGQHLDWIYAEPLAAGGTTYTLAADPGALALAGAAADLSARRALPADSGALAVAGQAADLSARRLLPASPGSLALTGSSADLTYLPGGGGQTIYTLDASPGSLALTGAAATLSVRRGLAAEPGALLLAGAPATLRRVYRTPAEAGALALAGQDADLSLLLRLLALPGALTITGSPAALLWSGDTVLPPLETLERDLAFTRVIARDLAHARTLTRELVI